MEIKIEYIEGEVRGGYYVHSMMKRRWAVELDMLRVIDAVCKRHGIKYYGWYGTLLGAVRHQGFIPWDDDMDLAMLREDYEKFQYVCRTELPEGWKLSKSSPSLICIKNTDSIRLDQKFLDRYHGYPLMTGVDIFCLDQVPPNRADEEMWMNLFLAVYILFKRWDSPQKDERWEEENQMQLQEIEKLTGYHFDRKRPLKEQLYFLMDRIAAMYWDTECSEVAEITKLYEHRDHRIPKACFDRVVDVPFEDLRLPVLEDYNLVCRMLYGDDYMTPVKEHAHDSVKEQTDILRDYFAECGMVLPQCYDMEFQ